MAMSGTSSALVPRRRSLRLRRSWRNCVSGWRRSRSGSSAGVRSRRNWDRCGLRAERNRWRRRRIRKILRAVGLSLKAAKRGWMIMRLRWRIIRVNDVLSWFCRENIYYECVFDAQWAMAVPKHSRCTARAGASGLLLPFPSYARNRNSILLFLRNILLRHHAAMSTSYPLMMPPCLSICPVLAKLSDAVPKSSVSHHDLQ